MILLIPWFWSSETNFGLPTSRSVEGEKKSVVVSQDCDSLLQQPQETMTPGISPQVCCVI